MSKKTIMLQQAKEIEDEFETLLMKTCYAPIDDKMGANQANQMLSNIYKMLQICDKLERLPTAASTSLQYSSQDQQDNALLSMTALVGSIELELTKCLFMPVKRVACIREIMNSFSGIHGWIMFADDTNEQEANQDDGNDPEKHGA